MNYIYDIFLDFEKNLYDFYDWNIDDEITHIRKIPAFKISSKELKDIKNNIIKINNTFLKQIHNKTEQFKKNEIAKMKYTSIFSDGKDAIAIKFSKNGISYMKSTLAIDEQNDIIDIIKSQKEINLKYKIIKKLKQKNFKTRFEIENEKIIYNELNKINKGKDYKKMSYICLECFGKPEPNITKAINKIKKEIIKGNDNFYKIFKIFKTINQK